MCSGFSSRPDRVSTDTTPGSPACGQPKQLMHSFFNLEARPLLYSGYNSNMGLSPAVDVLKVFLQALSPLYRKNSKVHQHKWGQHHQLMCSSFPRNSTPSLYRLYSSKFTNTGPSPSVDVFKFSLETRPLLCTSLPK